MRTANIPPSGFYRYPTSVVVTAALGDISLTAGCKSVEQVSAVKEVFALQNAQGFMATFHCGTGATTANNDTFSFSVWMVHNTYDASGNPTGLIRFPWGTGTGVFGAGTTVGGVAAAAGLRVADTLTWTANAYCTAIELAYGSAGTAAFSPAGDVTAALICPHTGFADGMIVELDPTGTSADVFCMIARK